MVEAVFQYGAEAFEAHQQETTKAMITDKATKNVPVRNGKRRLGKVLLNLWSFSAKTGHFLQGVLNVSLEVLMIKMYLGYS